MNVKCSRILELLFYKIGLDRNTPEATENIYHEKCEGAVDYTTIIWWFKKFLQSFKNLDNQAMSGKPITANLAAVLQAKEIYPTSSP